MLESDDELALSVLKKEEEKEQEHADYEDDGLYSLVNSHIGKYDSNNHVCSAQVPGQWDSLEDCRFLKLLDKIPSVITPVEHIIVTNIHHAHSY